MQFPYYYTPVAGNYSPAERDEMFGMIRNADTPGNLASYNGVLALAPRPNLLDNAYFVGGGTGYGIFPVNQRGVTQYSGGSAKIFDRWAIGSGGGAADLLSGGVKFTCGNGQSVYQRLSTRPADLFDKELTLSAVDTDNNLYTGTGTAPSTATAGNVISISITGFGTLVLAYSTAVSLFYVAFNGQSGSSPITIADVKLEFGSVQTLAHQESGNWVLNEIPDYTIELMKCQRYLYVFNKAKRLYTIVALGMASDSTHCSFLFSAPQEMKTTSSQPTLSYSGAFRIADSVSGGTRVGVTGMTMDVNSFNGKDGTIVATVNSGLTQRNMYFLQTNNDANAKIIISSEP